MAHTLKPGERLKPGDFLTSKNGRYLLANQGDDGNVVVYRTRDMTPIWATGTAVPGSSLDWQGDGNLVTYGPDGRPIWASDTVGWPLAGGTLVLDDDGAVRLVAAVPSSWNISEPDPDPGPSPTPGDVPGARGLARAIGVRAVGDDDGPKLYVGLSRMAWLWFWKFDRDRVLRELDADRAAGYRYGRILAQVGDPEDPADYWAGRIVDPDWPDYESQLAGLLNAARERGHLIEVTISGKAGPYDTTARRPDLVRRIVPVLAAHQAGVLFQEVMNEPNVQNTIGATELLNLAALAQSLAPGLLTATGAVWTEPAWVHDTPYPDAVGFTPEGWARTQADVGICHLDRDQSKSELRDRPWRQGWDVGLEDRRWVDNEALGPGSSVTTEARPDVLRSHRAVNFIVRAFASTLHGEPGVRGNQRWEDEPAYRTAPNAVRFLPGTLPNGTPVNANDNFPERPFTLPGPFVRADNGNTRGIVRCYSVHLDGAFYSIPFGPVSPFELRAERDLRVECYQQDIGDQLWARDVGAGDVLAFDGTMPDYLLISRPV